MFSSELVPFRLKLTDVEPPAVFLSALWITTKAQKEISSKCCFHWALFTFKEPWREDAGFLDPSLLTRTRRTLRPWRRSREVLHSWTWGANGRLELWGRPAAMYHLRTTLLRLRPLTAAQAIQSASPGRLAGLEGTPPSARFLKTTAAPELSFNGTGSNYVEEMYAAWLEDPRSVHKVLWGVFDAVQRHQKGHNDSIRYSPLHLGDLCTRPGLLDLTQRLWKNVCGLKCTQTNSLDGVGNVLTVTCCTGSESFWKCSFFCVYSLWNVCVKMWFLISPSSSYLQLLVRPCFEKDATSMPLSNPIGRSAAWPGFSVKKFNFQRRSVNAWIGRRTRDRTEKRTQWLKNILSDVRSQKPAPVRIDLSLNEAAWTWFDAACKRLTLLSLAAEVAWRLLWPSLGHSWTGVTVHVSLEAGVRVYIRRCVCSGLNFDLCR